MKQIPFFATLYNQEQRKEACSMTSLTKKGRMAAVILTASLCLGCVSHIPQTGASLPTGTLASMPTKMSPLGTHERLAVIPQADAAECVALLPKQPVCDDDTARALAYQITQYCGPGGILIPEFGGNIPLHSASALQAALYHTSSVLLPLEYCAETGEYLCTAYPNHHLYKLFQEENRKGRLISEFIYQDDAIAKAKELFGDAFVPHTQDMPSSPFAYYADERVFARQEDLFCETFSCPVILSWSESGKIVRALALMGETKGAGCPIIIDETVVSVENLAVLQAKVPLCSFTFEKRADGGLSLTGYQCISPEPHAS